MEIQYKKKAVNALNSMDKATKHRIKEAMC